MYINNIIMGWDSPQCIHDLISVVSGANRICSCTFHRFAILLSPEVPSIVRSKDFFLELSALISFQKSFHSPLWSFDSIDWERSWSSFSLKNFISCLKAVRALHISSAIVDHFWLGPQYSSSSLPPYVLHSTPLLPHSTLYYDHCMSSPQSQLRGNCNTSSHVCTSL